MRYVSVISLFLVGLVFQLEAQPNLSSREIIEGVAIYSDLQQSNRFYYLSEGMELEKDSDGRPHFNFAQMTHIPSRARGMEEWKQTSMIQFTIRRSNVKKNALREIRSILKKRISSAKPELVPVPVRKMEASLIYTNLDADTTQIINTDYQNNTQKKKGAIWTSKTFTIRPGKFTSQTLWDAIENNKGLLSVAYSLWTKGKNNDSISYYYSGPREFEEVLQNLNNNDQDSTQMDTEESVISAGAFQIDVDINKWPDLLKQIDFGSTLSPRYGLIDVYCYDFSDNIRPDLVGKIVEIEAQGVGNGAVKVEITFGKKTPEIVAHALKFEYAVRLDKPFKYRVIELTENGDVVPGLWVEKKTWSEIIDVSSKTDFEKTIKNNER